MTSEIRQVSNCADKKRYIQGKLFSGITCLEILRNHSFEVFAVATDHKSMNFPLPSLADNHEIRKLRGLQQAVLDVSFILLFSRHDVCIIPHDLRRELGFPSSLSIADLSCKGRGWHG